MIKKVEASLVTAILCTIQTSKTKYFRFCIPSGTIIDYEEMEMMARENGVSSKQWLTLLDKIEESMEKEMQ